MWGLMSRIGVSSNMSMPRTRMTLRAMDRTSTTEKKHGKRIYKTGGTMGVRIGKGGPEIMLDGFNGDMYILKK